TRSEMTIDRFRRDAAPGKHAGDQFIMASDLGNGERPQLACRVKPRPPRLAKRRGLHIEKVISGRHSWALDPATRAACESLAAKRIMTERVLFQKEFEPVGCPPSPVVS